MVEKSEDVRSGIRSESSHGKVYYYRVYFTKGSRDIFVKMFICLLSETKANKGYTTVKISYESLG